MAKTITAKIKIHIPAGEAKPSPPVGPALGQHGVNIMEFCKAFNSQTEKQKGFLIPVVITVYQDRTFTVKPDKGKVRVLVSIFGRSTPVELNFDQITKK